MKSEFCMPDYSGGSIVNLMTSIGKSRDKNYKSLYPPLRILKPEEIKEKNVVLFFVDGLGYEYLKNKKSFLNDYLRGKITSTFLPSTACAATAFLTGVAPQQHALTGWNILFRELGVVTRSLPFTPRYKGPSISENGISFDCVFSEKSFTSKINANSFIINPSCFKSNSFNEIVSTGAKKFFYESLDEMFKQIKKAIDFKTKKKKYVYSYWGDFDKLSHKYGINSNKVEKHFFEIESRLKKFLRQIKGTDTLLIVVSDHGLIDVPREKSILLDKHPIFKDCLFLPFCGDSRTKHLYVKSSRIKVFKKYMKKNFSDKCWLFDSEYLIKKNYYGLGIPNPNLFDRVGNFTLVCKENYKFEDSIGGFPSSLDIGCHGGVSKDEMFVPLVAINCKNISL